MIILKKKWNNYNLIWNRIKINLINFINRSIFLKIISKIQIMNKNLIIFKLKF